MMVKRRIFLLVICFAALCLSAAPAMADFVDLTAEYTLMTVTNTDTYGDGTTASTIVESLGSAGSVMDMYIKDDGGNVLQSLLNEPYDLTAMLDFTLSGNVYSATGSLEVKNDGDIKIAGDFVSNSLTFSSYTMPGPMGGVYGIIEMTGSLTPQENETSILLGPSPWEFETISLADPSSFTHGDMMVLEFTVNYGTFQDFLANAGATGSGQLEAQIHSPVPAAVLLGIIGLGVAGLKLRKYA